MEHEKDILKADKRPVKAPDEAETDETSRDVKGLLKTNTTLLAWLVFLGLGGGLLTLYYAQIGYLPDVEWKSSIIYLAVASVIGGGIGLVFVISLLLPGLIWADFLISDPGFSNFFCYNKDSGELCLRTVMIYLGIPFGIVLLVSHFALKTDLIISSNRFEVPVYLVICIALLPITFLAMRKVLDLLMDKRQECIGPEEKQQSDDMKRRRIFKCASWFTLSVLLSQISMLVVYRLSGKPGGLYFFVLTIICTAGVWISNHVVAVRYVRDPKQAIVASLVAAALLLFAADKFSSLSVSIMTYYGFGEGHDVTLFVNDEGTTIIDKLKLPDKCDSTVRGKLCGIEILSKMGTEYYLRVDGRTFTLPKAAVIAIDYTNQQTK